MDWAFGKQTRDDEWADASEALILKRFANAPGLKLSDLRVECRDTICRVHAAFPSREYQDTTGNRLVAQALHELPGFARGANVNRSHREAAVDYHVQRPAPR